jgi:flavodoxin
MPDVIGDHVGAITPTGASYVLTAIGLSKISYSPVCTPASKVTAQLPKAGTITAAQTTTIGLSC